jgi:two-component system, chemotaxis family, CheB/CheR fusion protein
MSAVDLSFEQLLGHVRDVRGFDFSGYKRPSLVRRFEKRMHAVGITSFEAYRSYLDSHADEFVELFNTILINVTAFFRDPEAWEFLASDVLPQVVENAGRDGQIRVWSAGCASGEEAYTIAMLFASALGEDAYRERVKIYATDIDVRALTEARHAQYTTKQVEPVPQEMRERFFVQTDGGYAFRNDIRRAVIFGRNDLLQDPPISRVDLLVSRNTLMYFGPRAQQRILSNFYFALARRGFLMLGKAEALHSRTDLFDPYNLKRRVFVKNSSIEYEPRLAARPGPDARPAVPLGTLGEAGFEQAPVAELIVDSEGRLAAVNHVARATFGLRGKDIGRPFQDLEISYRPVELRSLIDQVTTERRPSSVKEAAWAAAGEEERFFDIHVAPLTRVGGELVGVGVSFADVTRFKLIAGELDRARRELETAYEELQSTVEELETTNEELQSTNEELETTNEELQSTNEELETMNEELQSTNEELETMNDELRERTDEALGANAFLSSILGSIHQSVVVVDREFRVQAWSRAASDLWGLRADEVEESNFLNLDIGIPVGELRGPIRATLSGEVPDPVVLEGHNRKGQPVSCEVSFAPLRTHRDEIEGGILVMSAMRT